MTLDKAALWTDGRYFLQGEKELDCNWDLQKSGRFSMLYLLHDYLSTILNNTLLSHPACNNIEQCE